jgi:tRNA pseudouridine32 synthase/23S rRNA pseudouridine746 synthase
MRYEIVFENDAWCAVVKPALTLSVPSREGADDGRPCVGLRLEKQLGARLWPVHRLDFEVSGLLLFAKTADAHRVGNDAFETSKVRKTYEALSSDEPVEPDARLHAGFETLTAPKEGEELLWSAPIVRGKRRSFVAVHGKEARTLASWSAVPDGRFWTLQPLTGRSHQLRVHMALAGFPIRGDALYASRDTFPEGIALRARRLDFSGVDEKKRLGLPENLEIPSLF